MQVIQRATKALDRLLGHGDAPLPVSLPMGAWAVAALSDGLAMATGASIYDAAARHAISVGLLGSAGAMVTGLAERRSRGVEAEDHPSAVAGHAAGGLLVGGLYVASLVLRMNAHASGQSPTALARGLAAAGGGIALANLALTRRLGRQEPRGRARLHPNAPLGSHPSAS